MPSLRYLNAMLTVLAVLLGLNLWTMWNATPGGSAFSVATPAYAQGTVNAAEQRIAIIDQLKKLNLQLAQMQQLLSSGKLRVQAEAPQVETATAE